MLTYIEVRSKDDDRFDAIAQQIRLLGGQVIKAAAMSALLFLHITKNT